MRQSLSYYLTIFIIKLKGLKTDFSKDPIDVKKIRKGDMHRPKRNILEPRHLRRFKLADSLITEIEILENSARLLVFIHGGAFISGPAQHHWDTAKIIAKRTNFRIWMCAYPKAPENKIGKISKNIDAIYAFALQQFPARQISIMGDSAGGTLAVSLVQRLIKKEIELPEKLILISPVMDASMTNSEIPEVDRRDPMLAKAGVLSAKKLCVGNGDLKNEMISPLYGSFKGFPPTTLFLAQNDITYPDQKRASANFREAGVKFDAIEGKNMPHIWPLLPVMKEAKNALKEVVRILNE